MNSFQAMLAREIATARAVVRDPNARQSLRDLSRKLLRQHA